MILYSYLKNVVPIPATTDVIPEMVDLVSFDDDDVGIIGVDEDVTILQECS